AAHRRVRPRGAHPAGQPRHAWRLGMIFESAFAATDYTARHDGRARSSAGTCRREPASPMPALRTRGTRPPGPISAWVALKGGQGHGRRHGRRSLAESTLVAMPPPGHQGPKESGMMRNHGILELSLGLVLAGCTGAGDAPEEVERTSAALEAASNPYGI